MGRRGENAGSYASVRSAQIQDNLCQRVTEEVRCVSVGRKDFSTDGRRWAACIADGGVQLKIRVKTCL